MVTQEGIGGFLRRILGLNEARETAKFTKSYVTDKPQTHRYVALVSSMGTSCPSCAGIISLAPNEFKRHRQTVLFIPCTSCAMKTDATTNNCFRLSHYHNATQCCHLADPLGIISILITPRSDCQCENLGGLYITTSCTGSELWVVSRCTGCSF